MKKYIVLGIGFLIILTLLVPTATAETVLDETTEISAQSHKSYLLTTNKDATWEVVLDADDSVDLYLMDRDEYSYYEDGENFQYYPEGSAESVSSKTLSVELPEGDYYLVIDNDNLMTSVDVSIKVTGESVPGFTFPILVCAAVAVISYKSIKSE